MNPCTRSTLFRLVLAIRLYGCGLPWAGRYVIPRKYKARYLDPLWVLCIRPNMLETLGNNFTITADSKFARKFQKIGETITIRRPGRFNV